MGESYIVSCAELGLGGWINATVCAALCAAMVLVGCASITRGTDEPVVFDSDPPGAEMRSEIINPCAEPDSCKSDGNDQRYSQPAMDRSNTPGPACVTPCTIQVKRNIELIVTFTKAGYQPTTIKLERAVTTAGGVGVAGNIIAGGVTGLVVDSVTGAGMDHIPNPMKVVLVPIRSESSQPKPRKNR